jgi:hypothetical protein
MTTWMSRGDSWPTLLRAADQRGIATDILEKDYWVTQSLRVISQQFPNDFVFKGGTSLSKCYGCIQRFSEDIDILIISGGRGRGATSTLMKNMVRAVIDELSLSADPSRRRHETGRHLDEYLAYPTRMVGKNVLDPVVLLEMGVRGEDSPGHFILPVQPMIADDLQSAGFAIDEYPDLLPCSVPVLHPGRTLVEKVMMLHSKVTKGLLDSGNQRNQPTKIGRHYHDIHRLLQRDDVRHWLQDRNSFLSTVTSHEHVNLDFFGNKVPPRPQNGYAASDAFRPDFIGHHRLAEFYTKEMRDLFLGPGDLPAWNDVIDTIQGSAALL